MSKEREIMLGAIGDIKESARQMMWIFVILIIPAVSVAAIPWLIALLIKWCAES